MTKTGQVLDVNCGDCGQKLGTHEVLEPDPDNLDESWFDNDWSVSDLECPICESKNAEIDWKEFDK